MGDWFCRHTGAAKVVLLVAVLLGVVGAMAVFDGHVLAGVALLFVALTLWGPIQPAISPTPPRRRDY